MLFLAESTHRVYIVRIFWLLLRNLWNFSSPFFSEAWCLLMWIHPYGHLIIRLQVCCSLMLARLTHSLSISNRASVRRLRQLGPIINLTRTPIIQISDGHSLLILQFLDFVAAS